MPASSTEAHEAWNAKVAQALYEAAELAAAGHHPPDTETWSSADGKGETTVVVRVSGTPPE